jgi:excisionase family DNA binding protein
MDQLSAVAVLSVKVIECRLPAGETVQDSQPRSEVVTPRWYTIEQVAIMLNYGLTKTKYLVHSGQIRSVKDGDRRILPEWVDEYIRERVAEQSA